MTQDERWNIRYKEVVEFIEVNKRNPSKHRVEEHLMLNWIKANRKALNAGTMKLSEGDYLKLMNQMWGIGIDKTINS